MSESPFSAVLLAGGASRRMGSNKAALVCGGQPLWARQLGKLRSLAPAELFISGPAEGPYAAGEVTIRPDRITGCGPLGGLVTALESCRTDWLLVLAVDLPLLPARCLATLLAAAYATSRGVVPHHDDRFEPLAAVYPRSALPLAQQAMEAGRLTLQEFCVRLVDLHHAQPWPIAPQQIPWFLNANTPGGMAAVTGRR